MHESGMLAGEGKAGFLVYREGVHISPQHDHGPRSLASQDRGYAAGGLVEVDLERKTFQRIEHDLAGEW